ncbi:MAG: hypothetical protein M3Z75_28800 [Actinomycetota bacterium]|nr:hypothetical protein [Actinomycetota bacterium]
MPREPGELTGPSPDPGSAPRIWRRPVLERRPQPQLILHTFADAKIFSERAGSALTGNQRERALFLARTTEC